jgi:hypothetical protein
MSEHLRKDVFQLQSTMLRCVSTRISGKTTTDAAWMPLPRLAPHLPLSIKTRNKFCEQMKKLLTVKVRKTEIQKVECYPGRTEGRAEITFVDGVHSRLHYQKALA